MTYEKFMRELMVAILQREEVMDKEVRLLEKDKKQIDAGISSCLDLDSEQLYIDNTWFHEDVLCITWKVCGVAHMLHWRLEKLYERFCREGWQSVLPEIISKLKLHSVNDGYREIPERMIVRPLCYGLNRELLRDSVYWKFGDIALVLYLLVGDETEEIGHLRVNREMANQWNIPDEILLTNAMLHTYLALPPKLYQRNDIRGYRLTNADGVDGALAFFYPGMKERLADLLEGDYYVGFLNVNEVVVCPVRRKVLGELKSAVSYANTLLDERKKLTNRIYRYSSSYGRLIEV
ncbi:MAG: hypothetical protein K2O32_08750 [Acetatifactor sp.]|nr:hypothetical protein [Acetatifactor sp.]